MLTKQEVVEMLADSEGIMNYEQLRINISMKSWTPITRDDVLTMVYCINGYYSIIQHILSKLDETDNPPEITSS